MKTVFISMQKTDLPKKAGWYYVLDAAGDILPRMRYFNGNKWNEDGPITFLGWLKKVPNCKITLEDN